MDRIILWLQSFLSIIKTFDARDIIDIFCVTLVIYFLIKFIRDTKAVQLLKGATLLTFLYFISTVLNLTMFSAILRTFMEFGVLIIIIIFQPEIRRALEKIGTGKFLKKFGFTSQDDTEKLAEVKRKNVNDVVSMARSFSKKKVGALVVFERETKLGDIANTGTIVDATSSVSLLGNMFFNKAPLHDGAVIIRDGRVYAAGCILPLTRKNEDVDSNLGTRHRAAIGMSEESDAAVVIVSEETGTISLAYQGRLRRLEDADELLQCLEPLIVPEYAKADLVDYIPIFSSIRKDKKSNNGKEKEEN
ncbi:MAG: diadenylate cyclase CdaA [Acutalibacteraceae bacterium]